MNRRKQWKQTARNVVVKHYLMLIVVCLITGFIGSEFSASIKAVKKERSAMVYNTSISNNDGIMDVIETTIIQGLDQGKEYASEIVERKKAQTNGENVIFGHNRGIFATIVNSVTSGSFLIAFLSAIRSVFGSDNLCIALLVVLSFGFMFFLFFYIQNIAKVISRRIFLESRRYEKIPFRRYLFLLSTGKWNCAACTMFLMRVYYFLWCLTIVGGFIKRYSYFLVPYIVAENPGISPKKAINLSRQMMRGHKWECFLLECTFLGWSLLGILSIGLTEIFFSNPYKVATLCEYYAELREKAKEKEIMNSELLNDTYLFEYASKEVLLKAYPEYKEYVDLEEIQPDSRNKVEKFFIENLGVVFIYTKAQREYEACQKELLEKKAISIVVEGQTYPERLSMYYEKMKHKRKKILEPMQYFRAYCISSLIILFFIFSMFGWLWEVSLHLITNGTLVNRGVFHGPWIPIYGFGGVMILTILYRFRKIPFIEFISTMILCGAVEYFTAWYLEALHDGQKWWDYSGYYMNINGRVCAEGLLVFGIGGFAVVYIVAPMIDDLLKKIGHNIILPISIVLASIFLVDAAISLVYPNTGEGVSSDTFIMESEDMNITHGMQAVEP